MNTYVDLRIFSVTDVEFSIRHVDSLDPTEIDYKINGKLLKPNPVAKILGLETEIICVHTQKDSQELLMRYVNRMAFYVDNFAEVIPNENEKPVIDKGIVRLLLDLAIPTIRGILIEKTAGTSLSRYYLPLIPSNRLLP